MVIAVEKQKKWFITTVSGTAAALLLLLLAMVAVDPYFHYHDGLEGLSYRLYNERYINDGIAKHFTYDALITGSSMNQNFKTTAMDELLGTTSVKLPFSGAGYQEMASAIETALNSGNEVKYVLWGLDYNGLNREYDWLGYEDYPEYLYDDNLVNDVSYVWNKSLLFEGLFTALQYTVQGKETTSFDEYSSWEGGRGWESILLTYKRAEEIQPMQEISQGAVERVTKNVTLNLVNLANRYPGTEFLLFYTPYSVLYWESLFREGTLEIQLEAERIATQLLLDCENVRLYSFAQETEVTGELELYRDSEHYVTEVNDWILGWIAEGRGLLTKENYREIIAWEKEYYSQYDYDRLYETKDQE